MCCGDLLLSWSGGSTGRISESGRRLESSCWEPGLELDRPAAQRNKHGQGTKGREQEEETKKSMHAGFMHMMPAGEFAHEREYCVVLKPGYRQGL